MTSILLVLQFILAAILTVIVLLQKSSSIGLGAYSGSNESLFGAKGPAGFLTKLTFTLAIIFIINTLALGYLYNQAKKGSIVEEMKKEKVIPAVPTTPKIDTKKAPTAPKETK
jgi:preprotein translocase subunit SecG